MLLFNANLHTTTDGIITGGWLRMQDGIITARGDRYSCPIPEEGDLDLQNAPVTPGLIDAHCHLGLMEDSQRDEDTDDCNEWSGPITPHMRALDAINPLDRTFAEALEGGVTTICAGPGSANPIGGQQTVLKTHGRCIDEMVICPSSAMKLAFGENPRLHGKQGRAPYTRMGTAALIREAFLKAREYAAKTEREFDFQCHSLLPVLEGKLPVHAHAHRAHDMFTALRIGREFGFTPVLVHATEGLLVSDLLEGVRVIAGPSFGTRNKPELTHMSFKNIVTLSQAGLEPSLCTDAPALPIHSLSLMAGLAAKEGLPHEEALRAITLYPARTLGLEDRIGDLKVGTEADVVLWNTHPFMTDAKALVVWINGQIVLDNR